jgi:zinc transport system substrate-binding protein
VTTLFPQYDFARQIVGGKLTVGLLIPPGVEAHGYEPTSGNIITVNNSKLFIYTSDVMEPWASSLLTETTDTIVLNLGEHINPDGELHNHSVETSTVGGNGVITRLADIHDHDENDPHYWVDLVIAMQMIDVILEHIIEIDPENADYYIYRAELYYHEIEELHLAIDEYMHSIPVEHREIYHAGHVNMAYFSARYHMTVHSLTEEYAPDGDPTSSQISSMIEEIKLSGVKYLFYEELVTPRVANTIKTELKIQNYSVNLLLFHGAHNVSSTYFKNKTSYLEIMRSNFINLKIALDEYVE